MRGAWRVEREACKRANVQTCKRANLLYPNNFTIHRTLSTQNLTLFPLSPILMTVKSIINFVGSVEKTMENKNTFDAVLLIARPAAGKSEIIDHLKRTDVSKRTRHYHIGEFEEIDDFPMLWTWFEEDEILARLGHPRLHTDEYLNFTSHHLWDVLIERICLEYHKKLRDTLNYHASKTTIIEFARGTEHGGFARALQHLSLEVIERLAILYVNVPWEESLRKNRERFNPNRPDSILEHGLPDEKLEQFYRHVDWETVSAPDPEFINIHGIRVPYVVFENADDVTTQRGEALGERLEEALGQLWELRKRRQQSN